MEGKILLVEIYPESCTAWIRPIGESEAASQAKEHWDINLGQKRNRRLPCLALGLMIITVIMVAL